MSMTNSNNRDSIRVLVVEDDGLIRERTVEHMKSCSCEVFATATGEAAIEALQELDGFDAVFTDIRLGGKTNGWDVGETSRETYPDIPVVYTSGATLTPERPVPGSVFIPKPYDPEKVLGTIRMLLSRDR
jgi:CheY-like chemotaxis protein